MNNTLYNNLYNNIYKNQNNVWKKTSDNKWDDFIETYNNNILNFINYWSTKESLNKPLEPIFYEIYNFFKKGDLASFETEIFRLRFEKNQLYYLNRYNLFLFKKEEGYIKCINVPNISSLLHVIYLKNYEWNQNFSSFINKHQNNRYLNHLLNDFYLNYPSLDYLKFIEYKIKSHPNLAKNNILILDVSNLISEFKDVNILQKNIIRKKYYRYWTKNWWTKIN
jgi:hypothetical protein